MTMGNRKLIRPEVRKETSRSVRRKQSPPEQTNAEEFYYHQQLAARAPMVCVLGGGVELRGWNEGDAQNPIKLNRNREPNLMIFKQDIRYMFKEEELKRQKRRARKTAGGS